jgi:mono/diheme cytochrome c family protein
MNANMKTTMTLGLIAAASITLGLAAARGVQRQSTPSSPSNASRIERGKYLVTVGVCNDCHTPWKMGANGPEPDMTRMLSGHPHDFVMPEAPNHEGSPWLMTGAATNTAWAGPWGVSFTANLTPDEDTGLGAWSEDIFIKTLRTGKHWGQSRPLLPPMPWPNYGKMTDEDLKSVFAYLRSIPPVHNAVPLPIPPGGADKSTELASN